MAPPSWLILSEIAVISDLVHSTASTAAYCNTVSISSDIIDYWCNDLDNSTPQHVFTTYSGETDGRTFSAIISGGSSSFSSVTDASSIGQPSASDVTQVSSSSSTSSTTSSASTTTTSSSGGGGSGSSTPTGAIVGGVVGGVAVISLVGFGIWFLRRRQKKKNTAPPAAGAAPMQQHGAPPPGYDPKTQSYYNYNQAGAQPYPPGQQQYGQMPVGGYYPHSSQTTSPDPHAVPLSPSTMSHDPRLSQTGASPVGGYQPQQQAIHEAPTLPSEDHRGVMHELG